MNSNCPSFMDINQSMQLQIRLCGLYNHRHGGGHTVHTHTRITCIHVTDGWTSARCNPTCQRYAAMSVSTSLRWACPVLRKVAVDRHVEYQQTTSLFPGTRSVITNLTSVHREPVPSTNTQSTWPLNVEQKRGSSKCSTNISGLWHNCIAIETRFSSPPER